MDHDSEWSGLLRKRVFGASPYDLVEMILDHEVSRVNALHLNSCQEFSQTAAPIFHGGTARPSALKTRAMNGSCGGLGAEQVQPEDSKGCPYSSTHPRRAVPIKEFLLPGKGAG